MFGNFFAGAGLSNSRLREERPPPERPVTIVFPSVGMTPAVGWSDDHPPPDFQRLFAGVQRAGQSLNEQLKALNCDRKAAVQGDALLPERDCSAGSTTYVPTWNTAPTSFSERVAELDITTTTGIEALLRKTGAGARRLTHFRNFWIKLENMAEFWDTEGEKYYYVEGESASKKAKIEEATPATPATSLRYKGRREGNGKQMPDKYRDEAVAAFVEGAVSAFGCRPDLAYKGQHRSSPILQVATLELPVRITGAVTRAPGQQAAREGPIIGILSRNTIDFSHPDDTVSPRKAEHDILRELAAMLAIAQQRRSAVKTQAPLTGWWTTEPRWGGKECAETPSLKEYREKYLELQRGDRTADNEIVQRAKERELRIAKDRFQNAENAFRRWRDVRPGKGLYENAPQLKAIGKVPGSNYDVIYFVSSLFHHISICKLTVHDAYTDYLTTGILPSPLPVEKDWCKPLMERSVWYDLLDQKDRVKAFEVLWGIMEYMNRDKAKPGIAPTASI